MDYLKPFNDAIGKEIASVALSNDELHFVFADGSKVRVLDDGQSCCEARYMTTDDNLDEYAGAKLLGLEIKDAPDIEERYDVHEVQFLEVMTSRGCFTMATHNEHNGYYGGFSVRAMPLD